MELFRQKVPWIRQLNRKNFVVSATVSVPDSFQRLCKMPQVNEIHQLFISELVTYHYGYYC